jgi:hypothetical protein
VAHHAISSRRKGRTTAAEIAAFIADISRRPSSWVVAYLALDFAPNELERDGVELLTPRAAVDVLLAFDSTRNTETRHANHRAPQARPKGAAI